MELDNAQKLANEVIDLLQSDDIVIGGSIRRRKPYVKDIDHPDRDPKFEREIVEEAHGFIKHRDYKNLETVDWIELSPKGWYMATLTDAECEELYQEASEWLYNAT